MTSRKNVATEKAHDKSAGRGGEENNFKFTSHAPRSSELESDVNKIYACLYSLYGGAQLRQLARSVIQRHFEGSSDQT